MNKPLPDESKELGPAEWLDLVALTEEQKVEIDRRLAEHERNPERAKAWDKVLVRITARFDK